jgi:hypothetical protein
MTTQPDPEREIQHAEVAVRVAVDVDKYASEEERKSAICRALRLSDYKEGVEIRPGLSPGDVSLSFTETPEEAGERKMAEAEAEAESRAQRRYERHLDERGGRHLW